MSGRLMEQGWADLAAHVTRSLAVGRGTTVAITLTDLAVRPAAVALVEAVYRAGGNPQVLLVDEEFDRLALRHADDDVLRTPGPVELAALDWAEVHVALRGMTPPDPRPFPAARSAALRRAKGTISTRRWQQTRWSIVRIPTPGWADLIGVSPEELLGEFFAGCLDAWDDLRPGWDALASRLDRTSAVRVLAPDTDLSLGVAGRRWVVFAGAANLPDGEIATAPVDDTTQGHIAFPGTFWFAGTAISDLHLRFEAGRVVEAAATDGEAFVQAMLDADGGSRRVGELGIGLNPAMTTMTGDLFFDEKVLGTVHLALGRAYPECGGTNESQIHWDIVKDLRPGPRQPDGGSLHVDDLCLVERGRPTHHLLPTTQEAS